MIIRATVTLRTSFELDMGEDDTLMPGEEVIVENAMAAIEARSLELLEVTLRAENQ